MHTTVVLLGRGMGNASLDDSNLLAFFITGTTGKTFVSQ